MNSLPIAVFFNTLLEPTCATEAQTCFICFGLNSLPIGVFLHILPDGPGDRSRQNRRCSGHSEPEVLRQAKADLIIDNHLNIIYIFTLLSQDFSAPRVYSFLDRKRA